MSAYNCHSKPRPNPGSTYKAQAGWKVWQGNRKPVWVSIKSAFDMAECAYTKQHASDPECLGCVHRTKASETGDSK